jgi:Transposase
MEVWLVDAAHIRANSRRKTDVKDAEWVAQLLESGLLLPSFVPTADIRPLRMLTRYRVQLMADRTTRNVPRPCPTPMCGATSSRQMRGARPEGGPRQRRADWCPAPG